jgi:Replication protein A C terminal
MLPQYPQNDIRQAIGDLSSEGLIFSTIDENHFGFTAGM